MNPISVRRTQNGDTIVAHGAVVAAMRNDPRHHLKLVDAMALLTSQVSSVSEKTSKILSDVHPDKALVQVQKAIDEGVGPAWSRALTETIAAYADNVEYDAKRSVLAANAETSAIEREHRDRFATLSEIDQIRVAHTGNMPLLAAIFRDGAPKVWKFSGQIADRIRADMRIQAHRDFIAGNYSAPAKSTLANLIPTGRDDAFIDDLLEQAETQRSERIDDVVAAETYLRGLVAVAAAATDRRPEQVFSRWMSDNG